MAFHHNANYMLPSLTFPFHFFYSISKSMSVFHWQFFITYIFAGFLTFWACYIKGQWSEIKAKNVTLNLHIPFWCFLLFSSKNLCFYHFHFFFFWWSIEAPQQNINQSETGRFCQGNCICTKPASGCKEMITTNLQQIFLGNFYVRYQHSERICFECGFRKYY